MENKKLTTDNLSQASGGAMSLGSVKIKNAGNIDLSDNSSEDNTRLISNTNIHKEDRKSTQIGIDLSGLTSAVAGAVSPGSSLASSAGDMLSNVTK